MLWKEEETPDGQSAAEHEDLNECKKSIFTTY